MKLLPVLALSLAPLFSASADVVIEQKVESAMLNGPMLLKIRADRARMDMPSPTGPMTALWNFKTGESTMLMSAQKIAMKGSIRPTPPAGATPAKPTPTGVTEQVGAYTADVYDYTSNGTTGKLWVARNYPHAELLKAELRKMSSATPLGFDTSTLDVPGMMVKSVVTTPAGPVTITLVSARQQAVPDSEFAIPPGYKEMGTGVPNSAASAAPLAPTPVASQPAPAAPAAPAEAPVVLSDKAKRHWTGRFKELDTNGDGKLTLEEFLAGPMGKKTPLKARAYFEEIDKQHMNSITLDQFVASHAESEPEPEPGPLAAKPTKKPAAPAAPIPAADPAVIVSGVVLDRSDKGLLIETTRGSVVWLAGYDAKVKMTIEVSAFKTEPHTYISMNGKKQTIDGYKPSLPQYRP